MEQESQLSSVLHVRLPEQGVVSEQKVGLRSNCESEKENRLTNEEEEKSKRKHNSESQSQRRNQ